MSIELAMSLYTIGPYVLGQRLGHGGMGEVYVAARIDGTGGPVALKLLLPHLSEHRPAVEMFINEARLVAHMAHPNVVRILDVGVDGNRYYLAMELVAGVPLTALIAGLARARQVLAPELVLHIAHQLFEGLHHAHTLNDGYGLPLSIVHRDISPQNVLVSVDGEVKITDFGIAKAQTSPHFTEPGRVRGKCEYVAPEQARGQWVDLRADLFAAAATLAHVATLRSPFLRGGISETMRAAVLDPFPDLLGFRPDLDPRLCSALAKAAEKNPHDRFPNGRAVCEALPPPPHGAARELGALVQALCAPALAATVEATRELETHTGSRPWQLPNDTAVSPVPPPSVFARGWKAAALGAGLTAVAMTVLMLLPEPEPFVPEPIPVVVAPEPEPMEPVEEPEPEVADALPELPVPPPRVREVRSRPAKRTHPPRPGMGSLTVDAIPWAEVWVGGKRLGETPIAGVPLEAGEVRVKLKNPKTGNEVTRTVLVRRGHEALLREDLR